MIFYETEVYSCCPTRESIERVTSKRFETTIGLQNKLKIQSYYQTRPAFSLVRPRAIVRPRPAFLRPARLQKAGFSPRRLRGRFGGSLDVGDVQKRPSRTEPAVGGPGVWSCFAEAGLVESRVAGINGLARQLKSEAQVLLPVPLIVAEGVDKKRHTRDHCHSSSDHESPNEASPRVEYALLDEGLE